MNNNEWINVRDQIPPQNMVVDTKIDDKDGVRNHQLLKLNGKLWYFKDDSMYVYYCPTHWRHIELSPEI